MEERYQPEEIEARWQKRWDEKKVFSADNLKNQRGITQNPNRCYQMFNSPTLQEVSVIQAKARRAPKNHRCRLLALIEGIFAVDEATTDVPKYT